MGYGDTAWLTQSNLKQAPQLVPPPYTSPHKSGGGLSRILGGLGGAAAFANPVLGAVMGAVSALTSILGSGDAERERRERERKARALAMWQALDEPWSTSRYGEGRY